MSTRLCGIAVFLFTVAAWAGAATSLSEPAKAGVEKPGSFNERAVADFHRGKAIQIIVGHGAGGGIEYLYANHRAPSGKAYTRQASIIVIDMLGAGGLVSASHIYNRAPNEGAVMDNVIGGIVRSQLLGLQGVEFDAGKFLHAGAPNNENSLLLMTKSLGISRFEQLQNTGGRVVSIGFGLMAMLGGLVGRGG